MRAVSSAAGLHGETNFGTRGEKHDFGFTGAGRRFGGNISAAGDRVGIHFVTIEERNVLAREHEAGRAVAALDGARPGDDRLDRVGGTPDMHAGDEAQTGHVLDGLMRRAVFTKADRVMREDVDDALLHEGGHAQGVAGIVGERQERGGVRNETAVERNAVHDGGHAELTDAVADVAGKEVAAVKRLDAGPFVRFEPVGRRNRRADSGSAAQER